MRRALHRHGGGGGGRRERWQCLYLPAINSIALVPRRSSMSAAARWSWLSSPVAVAPCSRAPTAQPPALQVAWWHTVGPGQRHSAATAALGWRKWRRRGGRRSATAAAAAAAKQKAGAEAEEPGWASYEEEHLGPAVRATLNLLEWGRLCSQVGCWVHLGSQRCMHFRSAVLNHSSPSSCQQVAAFAQTTLGQRATAALLPPPLQAASERALQETAAADALESQFAADLDFGGIQTAQACCMPVLWLLWR